METCFSAPAGMARANHEIKDKEAGMAQSSTSLSMPSISASRPCPYLGSRKNPGISFDRPSRGNICFGKERGKLKLFRRVNVPYTAVSRSKQADLCLGSFSDCPIFIEKSEKKDVRVPPGVHAELGYIFLIEGQKDQAIIHLKKEKLIYPESTKFIDDFTQNIEGENQDEN